MENSSSSVLRFLNLKNVFSYYIINSIVSVQQEIAFDALNKNLIRNFSFKEGFSIAEIFPISKFFFASTQITRKRYRVELGQ